MRPSRGAGARSCWSRPRRRWHRRHAGLSKTPALVSTADTVIYADGRAVTSDLGSVSQHLNELGWASRPIEIVGAGTSTRLPPASTTRRRG